MTETDSETPTARYRRAAKAHGEATESGDSDAANASFDRAIAALHDLRRTPGAERAALSELSGDEDPHVRCWAATHLLPLDEPRAREVLAALASGPGIVGFNAKMVLEQWSKGELDLA